MNLLTLLESRGTRFIMQINLPKLNFILVLKNETKLNWQIGTNLKKNQGASRGGILKTEDQKKCPCMPELS